MFGLFRRRREDGTADQKSGAPRLSADLRALQDREFAERLNQRLREKGEPVGGGKVEPKFKTVPTAKPASGPQPASARPAVAPTLREAPKPGIRPKGPAVETPATPAPTRDAEPLVQPTPAPTLKREVPAVEPPAVEFTAPAPQPLPALPIVMRAAQFAADRHKNQRRRGAAREPYVNHLLEVAALLAAATGGQDPDLVIAGLLHDLIEDQGVSADDIARQFGVGVAALVLEVTTDKSLSDAERRRLQIEHAGHKSPRARMLRIADLTSNLRALRQSPPADWTIERQREYFRWAHDVVAASRGLSPQLDGAFDEAHAAGPAPSNTAAEPPAA